MLTVGTIFFLTGYFLGESKGKVSLIPSESGLEVISLGKVEEASPPATPSPSPVSGVININTASEEELDLLPGIGPAIAKRIIEYRQENGMFIIIDEIMSVQGIGESLFEKIKDYITVR